MHCFSLRMTKCLSKTIIKITIIGCWNFAVLANMSVGMSYFFNLIYFFIHLLLFMCVRRFSTNIHNQEYFLKNRKIKSTYLGETSMTLPRSIAATRPGLSDWGHGASISIVCGRSGRTKMLVAGGLWCNTRATTLWRYTFLRF